MKTTMTRPALLPARFPRPFADRWERERMIQSADGKFWSPYPEVEWAVARRKRLFGWAFIIGLLAALLVTLPLAAQPVQADTPAVAIPGKYGWGSDAGTTCNRDTVFVYRVVNPVDWDSVWTNFGHLHPDTLKVAVGILGGWTNDDPQILQTNAVNCFYAAYQTTQGDGFGWKSAYSDPRYLSLTGVRHRDIIWRGGTYTNHPRNSNTSQSQKGIGEGHRIIVTEQNTFGAAYVALRIAPAGATDTINSVLVDSNLFGLCADIPIGSYSSTGDNGGYLTKLAYARNVFHTCNYRNPLHALGSNSADTTNAHYGTTKQMGNFNFNTRQANVEIVGRVVDIQDMYTMAGPWSLAGQYLWSVGVEVTPKSDVTAPKWPARIFVERLIGYRNRDTLATAVELWTKDGAKQEVSCYYRHCRNPAGGGDPRDTLGSVIKRDTALTDFKYPLARINPHTLKATLVGVTAGQEQVGDYHYIQCDGTFAPRGTADSVFTKLMQQVRDSTGHNQTIDSTFWAARFGYTKNAGTACPDLDADGMPNAYEKRIAGATDSTSVKPQDEGDGDGYTAIEEFVNGTDPLVFTYYDGTEGEEEAGTQPFPRSGGVPWPGWFMVAWLISSGIAYRLLERTDDELARYRRMREREPEAFPPLREVA